MSSLPFCAGVQFSRNSTRVFNNANGFNEEKLNEKKLKNTRKYEEREGCEQCKAEKWV